MKAQGEGIGQCRTQPPRLTTSAQPPILLLSRNSHHRCTTAAYIESLWTQYLQDHYLHLMSHLQLINSQTTRSTRCAATQPRILHESLTLQ